MGTPDWHEMVFQVCVCGRPDTLSEAAGQWEVIFRNAATVATQLREAIGRLESWQGDAATAFRAHLAEIANDIDQIHEQNRRVTELLHTTATALRTAQARMPIPDTMLDEVTSRRAQLDRANSVYGVAGGGLLAMVSSSYRDFVGNGLREAAGWLKDKVDDHTAEARKVYTAVGNTYANANATAGNPGSPPDLDKSHNFTPELAGSDVSGQVSGLGKAGGGGGSPWGGGGPSGMGGSIPSTGHGLPGGAQDPGPSGHVGDPNHPGWSIPDPHGGGTLPGSGLASVPGSGLGRPGDSLGGGGVGGLGGGIGGVGGGAGVGTGVGVPVATGLGPTGTTAAPMTSNPLTGPGGSATGATGGGLMGAGAPGGQANTEADEYSTWLTEDEDVWGANRDDIPPPVLGL